MMLNPSYTELTDVLNKLQNVDNQITSRYSIVLAAAKRARQLIDGATPTIDANIDKAVSTAIKEMHDGHLNVRLNLDQKTVADEVGFREHAMEEHITEEQ